MCVCVCVCGGGEGGGGGQNELNVYTMLAYPRISSFRAIYKHMHTRILKPFEDSEPTGLKVDTATMSPQTRERTLHRTGRGPTFTMRVDAALSRVQVPDQVERQVFTGVAHFLHLDHAARQLQQGWWVVHQVLQVCPEQYMLTTDLMSRSNTTVL